MTALRSWWHLRSPRERRLLGVMLALLVLLLGWLAVVRPLGDAVGDARQRYGNLLTEYQDVRAMADRLNAAAARQGAAVDVRRAVSDSAAATGISFGAQQPLDAGGVLVTIDAIRPTVLFTWIAGLQQRGVVADRVAIGKNDDATVSAQIGFPGRAS